MREVEKELKMVKKIIRDQSREVKRLRREVHEMRGRTEACILVAKPHCCNASGSSSVL